MATKVDGMIQKVNLGNTVNYAIASTAYGYCQTAAGTAAKVVDMTGFTLLEGTTIHVKFQYNNTAANPTLNVNGKGAKPIVQYDTQAAGNVDSTSGWYAGAVVQFTYDGTSWVRDQGFNYYSNTDSKVTQNAAITTANNYPVILGYDTSTSTTVTNVVNKSSTLLYNPSTKALTVSGGSVAATTFTGYLNGTANRATDTTKLPLAGGTMTGAVKIKGILGTASTDYGDTLPASGTEGQLFFQTGAEYYELPAGGTAGYVLTKNSAADRDVSWTPMAAQVSNVTFANTANFASTANSAKFASTANSATTLYDRTNSTLTYSNYGAAGLAATSMTWLTCWNGYELRAISKAEVANCVDASHKWVRIGGDTMSGDLTINRTTDASRIKAQNVAGSLYFYVPSSTTGPRLIYGSNNAGTGCTVLSIYQDNTIHAGAALYGAVWNDYAEYREVIESVKPGQCVIENGDDTMSLSTERMQEGAEIVSDTYGFAVGKSEKASTPIAVSGRVLAYPYEPRETYKPGRPVCSGPGGTISLMTDEEYLSKPWCSIGTVSSVPNYEVWMAGSDEMPIPIKIDGRIWIRVR